MGLFDFFKKKETTISDKQFYNPMYYRELVQYSRDVYKENPDIAYVQKQLLACNLSNTQAIKILNALTDYIRVNTNDTKIPDETFNKQQFQHEILAYAMTVFERNKSKDAVLTQLKKQGLDNAQADIIWNMLNTYLSRNNLR